MINIELENVTEETARIDVAHTEKTIVIVDDDQATLKMLEVFLSKLGYQVFCAESGTRAWELVRTKKPTFLISDMLLPGIHGVELCRKLKNDPELKDTKIILMTAVYSGGAYRSSDLNCDRDGFLEKPVDLKELKKVIQNL